MIEKRDEKTAPIIPPWEDEKRRLKRQNVVGLSQMINRNSTRMYVGARINKFRNTNNQLVKSATMIETIGMKQGSTVFNKVHHHSSKVSCVGTTVEKVHHHSKRVACDGKTVD